MITASLIVLSLCAGTMSMAAGALSEEYKKDDYRARIHRIIGFAFLLVTVFSAFFAGYFR